MKKGKDMKRKVERRINESEKIKINGIWKNDLG